MIEAVAAGIDPNVTPTTSTYTPKIHEHAFQAALSRPSDRSRATGGRTEAMVRVERSQAGPMTIWCLLVVILVMSFVAAGIALYFTPGQGQPIEHRAAPSEPATR
jgi:hypothetical protein